MSFETDQCSLTASRHVPKRSGVKRPFPVNIVPFNNAFRAEVESLLHFIPSAYPNGSEWLSRRLFEAVCGKARCTLACAGGKVVGVSIETPKGERRTKLSTFYIHPRFRRQGIGTMLLKHCRERWRKNQEQEVYVTVSSEVADQTIDFFGKFGFVIIGAQKDLYRRGSDEIILAWWPSTSKSKRVVIMSIKPHFAKLIYERNKIYEYRRVKTSLRTNDLVLVYETRPVGRITGSFRVGKVVFGAPINLIECETLSVAREAAMAYLQSASFGSAIEITSPCSWGAQIDFKRAFPGRRPPQSYYIVALAPSHKY